MAPASTPPTVRQVPLRWLALVITGGAVVALLVGMYIWMVPQAAARERAAACNGLRPSPNVSALCPPGQASCALPQPAPDFTATTIDNKQVRLSDFRGKVVLLNFWASWCSTCKAEKQGMAAMANDLRSSDFEIITLASDVEWAKVLLSIAIAHRPSVVPPDLLPQANGPGRTPTLAEAMELYGKAMPSGTPYAVYLDPPNGDDTVGQIATRWGIEKVPESFLIDANGMVRYYFVNKRDWRLDVFTTCVNSLIDES